MDSLCPGIYVFILIYLMIDTFLHDSMIQRDSCIFTSRVFPYRFYIFAYYNFQTLSTFYLSFHVLIICTAYPVLLVIGATLLRLS